MYNSLIIRIFVKSNNVFSLAYRNSFIKNIADVFTRFVSFLANNSTFISIFTKDLKIIEESLSYNIYSKLLDFGRYIFSRLNNLFKRTGGNSQVNNSINKLFRSEIIISIYKNWEKLLDSSFVYKCIKDLYIIDEWGE